MYFWSSRQHLLSLSNVLGIGHIDWAGFVRFWQRKQIHEKYQCENETENVTNFSISFGLCWIFNILISWLLAVGCRLSAACCWYLQHSTELKERTIARMAIAQMVLFVLERNSEKNMHIECVGLTKENRS